MVSYASRSCQQILTRASSAANTLVVRDVSTSVDLEHHVAFLERKATSNAPNGYTPQTVDCPSIRPSIRRASEVSPEETAWLSQRRNKTILPMQDLLSRLDITGFDVNSYMRTIGDNATLLPNIGLAFSGGGYRALMNGAGALAAFDSRTSGSNAKGHLGGLLQASTYIAGLSGGSWLVGSVYANNFTSVENILGLGGDEDAIWQFDETITKGPSHGIFDAASYVKSIVTEVADKKAAGFNTSLTDAWGRALSYQLVNNIDGGPGYTFSSIAQDATFKSGDSPMPVFVADGRDPDELVIDGNATVYEINPWELGTFDPTTFAFAPLEYLGSDFSDGKVSAEGKCVRGFDNLGYIMGTSSSLFNQGLLQAQGTGGKLAGLLTSFLEDVDEQGSKLSTNQTTPLIPSRNHTLTTASPSPRRRRLLPQPLPQHQPLQQQNRHIQTPHPRRRWRRPPKPAPPPSDPAPARRGRCLRHRLLSRHAGRARRQKLAQRHCSDRHLCAQPAAHRQWHRVPCRARREHFCQSGVERQTCVLRVRCWKCFCFCFCFCSWFCSNRATAADSVHPQRAVQLHEQCKHVPVGLCGQ